MTDEDVKEICDWHYEGKYHVLNGLISPIDGITPDELNISTLLSRIIPCISWEKRFINLMIKKYMET